MIGPIENADSCVFRACLCQCSTEHGRSFRAWYGPVQLAKRDVDWHPHLPPMRDRVVFPLRAELVDVRNSTTIGRIDPRHPEYSRPGIPALITHCHDFRFQRVPALSRDYRMAND